MVASLYASGKQGFGVEKLIYLAQILLCMGRRIYNIEGLSNVTCSYCWLTVFCELNLRITALPLLILFLTLGSVPLFHLCLLL